MRRLASETDLEQVFRIYMHESVIPFLGHDPMPLELFRGVYRDLLGAGAFFVYEVAGRVAGFFKIMRLEGRAHHVAVLGTFAVDPDRQGQGIGRAMMNEILSMLRGLGVLRVELLVEADNERARAFYLAQGFAAEGVLRKAYKRAHEDHYVDEIMMARLLGPGLGESDTAPVPAKEDAR